MSTQQNTQAPAEVKKTAITDQVLKKVTSLTSLGEMKIPESYSPENALKSAFLILNDQEMGKDDKRKVLEVCTKESIANCLFDMVIQGLSPMKKQCYFIPYSNKLTLSKSYAGNMMLAKRVGGVKNISATLIFTKDTFKYEIDPSSGYKKLKEHKQELENIDINEIKGVYATAVMEDGYSFIEVMTMKEVETSWMQGATKGNSPAHKNFRGEMAKKTAINRLCKLIINSSDDADLYSDFEASPEGKENAKEITEEETTFVKFEEVKEKIETPTGNPPSDAQEKTEEGQTAAKF